MRDMVDTKGIVQRLLMTNKCNLSGISTNIRHLETTVETVRDMHEFVDYCIIVMLWYPACLIRGGTSKGLFFNGHHLPTNTNNLFLKALGSPDGYG